MQCISKRFWLRAFYGVRVHTSPLKGLDKVVTVSQGCMLKGDVHVVVWHAGAVRHQPPGRPPIGRSGACDGSHL